MPGGGYAQDWQGAGDGLRWAILDSGAATVTLSFCSGINANKASRRELVDGVE
jgi:hypothetical protein